MNVMIEPLPESMPNHADVDALPASMPNHDDDDDEWEELGKASSVGSCATALEDFASADEDEPKASVGEPDEDCFSIGSYLGH